MKRISSHLISLLAALLGLVTLANTAAGQSRQMISLTDSNWQFAGSADDLPEITTPEFNSQTWTPVTLPHVFQTREHFNDVKQGWYRRQLTPAANLTGKRLYLVFEGAAAVADVYVNGIHLGQHRGAYTRYIVDATDALHIGQPNDLAVRVDDRPESTKDCLPSGTRLYTVWGGLYRKVWLMAVDQLHIDPTDDSSDGIYLSPTYTPGGDANLSIDTLIRNASANVRHATIRITLLDPAGAAVNSNSLDRDFPASARTELKLAIKIANPKPWEPATPNLYHLRTEILDHDNILDEVTEPTGFRTLAFRDGRVFINDKPIVLAGVSVHQETEAKASALDDEDIKFNFLAMRDLGCNWVRLPHYPHQRFEYDLCDQLGLLCWAEDGHSNRETPTETSEKITREMVKQNYNHPSIAVWSVGNEASADTAQDSVPIVKSLDSSKPVVVANMQCNNADFIGTNIYPGWYGRKGMWDFDTVGYISEIGGGGVTSIHCDYADATTDHKVVDKYEPEEYQQLLAETFFQKAFRESADKLGMFTWWTLRDFTDHKYKGPIGWNTKGLLTYAGDKKDVYYLYRAYLRPDDATVHICSARYFLRQGSATNGIKVYSNGQRVTLMINGQVLSTLSNGLYSQANGHRVDNVFYWPMKLFAGKNVVTATDEAGHSDTATIYFYGDGGLENPLHSDNIVKDLKTSNAKNTAYFMDMPIQPQWPIYSDLDSNADNSFDTIPAEIAGAKWIALRRWTKPGQETDLQFTLTRPAKVFIMETTGGTAPAGFTSVPTTNLVWRDNALMLVPANLYSQSATAGQTIHLGAPDKDAIVLIKED